MLGAARAWVQEVAQGVAEQVGGEHGQEDRFVEP